MGCDCCTEPPNPLPGVEFQKRTVVKEKYGYRDFASTHPSAPWPQTAARYLRFDSAFPGGNTTAAEIDPADGTESIVYTGSGGPAPPPPPEGNIDSWTYTSYRGHYTSDPPNTITADVSEENLSGDVRAAAEAELNGLAWPAGWTDLGGGILAELFDNLDNPLPVTVSVQMEKARYRWKFLMPVTGLLFLRWKERSTSYLTGNILFEVQREHVWRAEANNHGLVLPLGYPVTYFRTAEFIATALSGEDSYMEIVDRKYTWVEGAEPTGSNQPPIIL